MLLTDPQLNTQFHKPHYEVTLTLIPDLSLNDSLKFAMLGSKYSLT